MAPPTQSQMDYTRSLLQSPHNQRATPTTTKIKSTLDLQSHPEGGYFVETDRDSLKVPNPFNGTPIYPNATAIDSRNQNDIDETSTRSASTTIHYYLDPTQPNGVFHRNKGRTVHTLHWGRGIYVIIHADELNTSSNASTESSTSSSSTPASSQKARIETFTVGPDIVTGEKLQWIVEGGKFKASFLLPDFKHESSDHGAELSERGLLISETVVPGFEYMDHDFLTLEGLRALVGEQEFAELEWLVRRADGQEDEKQI